jgi:catechol 2,3-dioxygenase-like lactoylglutathione lyase family enzyme
MIAYTTLGVSDFDAAKTFYSNLLGVIGAEHVFRERTNCTVRL